MRIIQNQKKKLKFFNYFAICFITFIAPNMPISLADDNSQVTEKKLDLLEKLLPEGSIAPSVNGSIFYKKSNEKINSVAEFDKKLKNYRINFKNKVTVMQFWEKDCRYSKLILQKLEKINKKYRKKGVQCFALNTNNLREKEELIDFLNNYHNMKLTFNAETNEYSEKIDKKYFKTFNVPILFANKEQQRSYGIKGFPAVAVVDKNGILITAMVGYFEEYDVWLSKVIDNILKSNK